ncbi:MAG: methylmalonyl Co-A mutase-associated GTPase MeaB [Chloroflexi bacterium]|nr:MAG: methylmalonyl Co-A mutase-associated GTPase MeaB [Chloroflexota bacterium]
MDMFDEVLAGERLALARLLTLVENDTPKGRAALDYLYPHTGKAHLVGVTGSPGTGKSSLVNQLAKAFRSSGVEKVAVIAVDPSSPFTGGALLGDRVRMRDLSGDPGVFVRSMASRGALGGVSRTTVSMAQVMDAAGFKIILIETVGAGQSEVDIARLAHTVVVVEAPGLGDDIQAIKAGILEIADILVVNKCDLPGAERTARTLKSMLEMAHPTRPGQVTENAFWPIPVLQVCSTGCQGVEEVTGAICAHRDFLKSSGEWQRREHERMQNNLDALLRDMLVQRFHERLGKGEYQEMVDRLTEREISPFQAIEALLNET